MLARVCGVGLLAWVCGVGLLARVCGRRRCWWLSGGGVAGGCVEEALLAVCVEEGLGMWRRLPARVCGDGCVE